MEGLRPTKVLLNFSRASSGEERGNGRTLPNDLVIEILVRLPVKSLVRFRCVSKAWCRVLKSTTFANKHFLQKRINGRVLLMRRCLPPPQHDDVLSFHNLDSIELKEVRPNLHIPFLAPYSPTKARLLGPCKGLVCIVNNDRVILCNPALQEFKHLPSCPSGDDLYCMLGEGFGNSRSNDFKVVLMRNLVNDVGNILVHLYNSNTNSWRQIDYKGNAYPCLFHPYNEVFFNGACHWNATTLEDTSRRMVLCFDINNEVFKQLEYADCITSAPIDLTVVNECLTMLRYEGGNITGYLTVIWVMKEYGIKSSWTKQFIIMSKVLRYPLFWKDDECVLEERGKGQLVCYGHDTDGNKKIQVYGKPFTFRALIYEESLGKDEELDPFCYVLNPWCIL